MIHRFQSQTDVAAWRNAARALLARGVPPHGVQWLEPDAIAPLIPPPDDLQETYPNPVVPKAFLDLAERVVAHRSPDRFHHLYSLLWRGQRLPGLWTNASDHDVAWLHDADKSVRRDIHKMHAFVRFRRVGTRQTDAGEREVFAAWFEPDHRIIRLGTPWFMRRFVGMDWSILTPDGCASWDGSQLTYAPGVDRADVPDVFDRSEDAGDAGMEEAWRSYFGAIFNPSRLKIGAMKAEMPVKYWKNLPEAESIPDLVRSAEEKQRAFIAANATAPNIRTQKVRVMAEHLDIQQTDNITSLAQAERLAAHCQLCPLYEDATQTVWGNGPERVRLMFVGEQPGDKEDLAGEPFVGPAGQLFDEALAEVGIDRGDTYVTNAVKHFAFTVRGNRRIHRSPKASEINTCRVWLNHERALVRPDLIVTLGTSALRGIFGRATTLKSVRGKVIDLEATNEQPASKLIATVHPSFVLRVPDPQIKKDAYAGLVGDLTRARDLLTDMAA